MNNEKYVNHYIEIMTGTMTDAVIRNVSLQANARVTEEILNEQAQLIEQLQNNEDLKVGKLEQNVNEHLDTIANLNKQLSELNNMRSEYENVKHQVNHIDTFRNELVKERDDHQKTRNEFEKKIKKLNDHIEYLQLTPAKRKKIDETKAIKTVDVFSVETPAITEDGGSF
jgi:hypothetical protein